MGFRGNVVRALRAVSASKPAWFFAAVWITSVLVLLVEGQAIPVGGIGVGIVLLVLCLFVTATTEPEHMATLVAGPARRRVWAQLGLAAVIISLTAWNNLAYHNIVEESLAIPLWTPLVEWLKRLGEQWFGEGLGTFLINPVTYVLIPLILLLLAGARLPTLGFSRGHRVGRALLICCAVPLAWIAYILISGQLSIVRLLGSFASNFMQNGFLEEFLFRGILQTRLRLLTGPGWAMVLQALVFGVWHLGVGYSNTGHTGLLPAIAITIAQQSLIGLALGILFECTRNLVVPSVVHIALNSM